MEKTLVILSQYKAVPSKPMSCQGCAFDETGMCPKADCKVIIWVEISHSEEIIEE